MPLMDVCVQRKNNTRTMYRHECEPVNPILIMLPMMQYRVDVCVQIRNIGRVDKMQMKSFVT